MDRKILVAGSDLWLLNRIRNRFEAQDYRVTTATSTTEGLRRLFRYHPHLVIIDAGTESSDWDGWTLCRRVREIASIPVIMLVPSNGSDRRIKALKLGANDVLDRPVDLEELILRAVALLRRYNFGFRISDFEFSSAGPVSFDQALRPAPRQPFDATQDRARERPQDTAQDRAREEPRESVFIGGLWIDFRIRRVWIEDSMVDLTPREFQLLAYLVKNAGRILPPEEIQEEVWGDDASGPWVVRQYVSQVRRKIEEDPAQPRYVLTHPGIGYQFVG